MLALSLLFLFKGILLMCLLSVSFLLHNWISVSYHECKTYQMPTPRSFSRKILLLVWVMCFCNICHIHGRKRNSHNDIIMWEAAKNYFQIYPLIFVVQIDIYLLLNCISAGLVKKYIYNLIYLKVLRHWNTLFINMKTFLYVLFLVGDGGKKKSLLRIS